MRVEKTYFSTPEVAKHLGVSASWLNKLRMLGEGPRYYKLGARCVVYELGEVKAWVEQHGEGARHG
ncbi:helix-turn-helix transcriptional regulator [Roseicyclus sediminis]|uniref:helix-turn-helix transcriptional regulator n=1 Tax=Roseicyclus sediminis TaxID=2980997 RepID=UPI003873CC4F